MRTAGILLGVIVGWTMVYWAGSFVLAGESQRIATWTADVQFVFAGADQGAYPNGMPFSATDLISPPVLERLVADFQGLPDDVDARALAGMLTVAAHFPGADDLRRAYSQRLSGEMSLAENQEMEAAFVRDFERGARSRAGLFLTTSRTDLPAAEILRALPSVWADYMRDEYGVFRGNRPLYSSLAVDQQSINASDPLVIYLVLRQQVQLLKENVQTLQEEPNSGNVRDPETSFSLADIEARVGQFEELVLEGQLSDVLEAAALRNPEQARRFLEIRIGRQSQELALLQSQSSAIEDALGDYDVDQFTVLESAAGGLGVGGDGFLNRLIALGVEGGDLAFRQELTRQRLDYELEAAAVESDQHRLTALLEEMAANDRAASSLNQNSEAESAAVVAQLDELVRAVEQMFDSMERLADRLDQIRFGEDGRMVSLGEVTDQPAWTSGRFNSVHWQWYLLSLVAVVLIAALGALALSLITRRSSRFGQ